VILVNNNKKYLFSF